MASIIACVVCKQPLTFRDPVSSLVGIGKDWEHEVPCNRCGAKYAIVVRMTQLPTTPKEVLKGIKNRPSA